MTIQITDTELKELLEETAKKALENLVKKLLEKKVIKIISSESTDKKVFGKPMTV